VIKRLLHALKPASETRTREAVDRSCDPSFIDVKRLIAELSEEDLMRSADAYFSKIRLTSDQCWKPFSNPSDAPNLTRHLGLVLEAADLFHGAKVLDFGCATGWLTLGLAQMGCHAVGVDISPAALNLADALKARPGVARGGTVEFHAFDGHRLPLHDESIDRIICFDAFHHVRNPQAVLKEFARVLRNGGRAAFMEPGPNHSKTPLSQAEMANFMVIENDISMVEVTAWATEAGFSRPQMLVQFQRPLTIDVDEFNTWAAAGIPLRRAAEVKFMLQRQLTNGQCFFIYKGQPELDSLRAEGLAAELTLRSAQRVPFGALDAVQLEVLLRNTGTRHWITAAGPGQVNLGVHVLNTSGRVLNNNHGRIRLPSGPVKPGQSVLVKGTVPMPKQTDFVLRLDLVAEMVSWFADAGHTLTLTVGSAELRTPGTAGTVPP